MMQQFFLSVGLALVLVGLAGYFGAFATLGRAKRKIAAVFPERRAEPSPSEIKQLRASLEFERCLIASLQAELRTLESRVYAYWRQELKGRLSESQFGTCSAPPPLGTVVTISEEADLQRRQAIDRYEQHRIKAMKH